MKNRSLEKNGDAGDWEEVVVEDILMKTHCINL